MNKFLTSILLGLLSSFASLPAGAASSMWLSPDDVRGGVGDVLSFDLYMDFDVPTSGLGSLSIHYDTSLFGDAGFAYDSSFLSDVDSYESPVNDAARGAIENIGFYDMNGISGQHRIGILQVRALSEGTGALMLMEDASFITADIYGDPIAVTYTGANVTLTAVPVPAALWLFGSGLLGLAGVARRRRC